MTDEELIARLRDTTIFGTQTATEAADRIEALIAEQSNLVVAAHRQGYDQARAVSSELRRAMAERIMEHEAKLAKALEALLWCSGSADFNEGGVARKGWLKVCAPLLKGESHE